MKAIIAFQRVLAGRRLQARKGSQTGQSLLPRRRLAVIFEPPSAVNGQVPGGCCRVTEAVLRHAFPIGNVEILDIGLPGSSGRFKLGHRPFRARPIPRRNPPFAGHSRSSQAFVNSSPTSSCAPLPINAVACCPDRRIPAQTDFMRRRLHLRRTIAASAKRGKGSQHGLSLPAVWMPGTLTTPAANHERATATKDYKPSASRSPGRRAGRVL